MADGVNVSTHMVESTVNNTDGHMYTIEELNDIYVKQKVGGIVFVTLLMIVGVIGNAHVLYLFAFKFPNSNHRVYILCLAVLDMITCSVGMPFVIVDLHNTLTFESAIVCKLLRFLNYFNSGGSAFTLVVIAVDRYKKICHPLGKQMTERKAKIACCIALSISLIIAWPAPVLYGRSTVNTDVDGITGVACFTEDKFKKTKYQLYFNAVLILVVFGSFVALIVLYSLIGQRIWKQAKTRTKMLNPTVMSTVPAVEATSSSNSGPSTDNSIDTLSTGAVISSNTSSNNELSKQETLQTNVKQQKQQNETAEKPSKKSKENANAKKTRKTTLMLFIITVVFILSFAPHLALKITVFLNKKFLDSLTFVEVFLYHTFVWSFFINNMANPIIYGFCDTRFRREIRKMYGVLFRKRYRASVV
ncbi:neuropeptide S receptor-like [Ylistrum balloti]|uniref:neuropeptide S receptor-like n=1 Tax=Ylistrum balloti TaxID=509963 RepID=UPI002905E303|nr:neuropeptide S receptor-like [Ylistrum balloti]